MKPSEYLFNEDFMILNDDYKLKVINKLDKRFIDREELKLDIIDKFGNIKVYGLSQRYIKEIRNLKKEILELLKWSQIESI